ncbi:hypothetical protein HAX54_047087, partial [Datura stramonium]|nr:hypothetical protein [Datura stramonium]
AQLVSIRFQLVSGDVAMMTCELLRKCEILVVMKCNKDGKGRSMLTRGMNSFVSRPEHRTKSRHKTRSPERLQVDP